MVEFLQELVFSTPAALTDLQRESAEEADQRHERAVACSLAALAGLVSALLPVQEGAAQPPAGEPRQGQGIAVDAPALGGCLTAAVLSQNAS